MEASQLRTSYCEVLHIETRTGSYICEEKDAASPSMLSGDLANQKGPEVTL